MSEDRLSSCSIAGLLAHHLDVDPEGLTIRRIPTGKFNTSYAVEGGPAPLVLRIAPPDDRSRMLFYEHRMMRQEPGLHSLLREKTMTSDPATVSRLDPGPRLPQAGRLRGVGLIGSAIP
jgi:hypothetical protein